MHDQPLKIKFRSLSKEDLNFEAPLSNCNSEQSSINFRQESEKLSQLGLHSHPLKKAIGKLRANDSQKLTCLDATLGLGRDSLWLRMNGFSVIAYERNPTVIKNFILFGENEKLFQEDFELVYGSLMEDHDFDWKSVDIVYYDPMFLKKKESAKAELGMDWLRNVVSGDPDQGEMAEYLLKKLKEKAYQKLIVKRHPKSPQLIDKKYLNFQVSSKLLRFDVYI